MNTFTKGTYKKEAQLFVNLLYIKLNHLKVRLRKNIKYLGKSIFLKIITKFDEGLKECNTVCAITPFLYVTYTSYFDTNSCMHR